MEEEITITRSQLTAWAESLHHMNHHGTLVQREIEAGNFSRASNLSERARRRAWKMLNEMFACGAEKPENYCEPDGRAPDEDQFPMHDDRQRALLFSNKL